MPTILSHAAVPLALGLGLGARIVPVPLLLAGIAAAILPDLDVVAFKLGIPYAHALGHRGVSHSLVFAALVGLLALPAAAWFKCHTWIVFLFIFIATASHALLDMLTNGGLGVALLWPWSEQRMFAPWQMIQVSPIGLRRIFSARFADVLLSELRWIWVPASALCAGLFFAVRKRLERAAGNDARHL